MAKNFFRTKRPWSKYKDFILDYYIEPYIPKVARLGKPVLILDCFAGQGKFDDGEPGSPLILAGAIARWREKGKDVVGEFIESDPKNYERLRGVLGQYREFATPRLGMFEQHLPEIARRAKDSSVFLYVDPYTVKNLVFDGMKAVFDQIHVASSSVETLINFNVVVFMRWALSILKQVPDIPAEVDELLVGQDDEPGERVGLDVLNRIAGGTYWQDIARENSLSFIDKLKRFTDEYMRNMLSSFNYVCSCEIKEEYYHRVPKYLLIYATRHRDGVELMNEAMCKAERRFLNKQFSEGRLFDCTPEDELVNTAELRKLLLGVLREKGPMTRRRLRFEGVIARFGKYAEKDFNAAVTSLLKEQTVVSSTGKTRINDDVVLRVRAQVPLTTSA